MPVVAVVILVMMVVAVVLSANFDNCMVVVMIILHALCVHQDPFL